MNTHVRLTLVNDENEVVTFRFEDSRDCHVGSASDCDIRLPLIKGQQDVSRHHCVFHIDPPGVWLKVANNSRTYVNDLPVQSTSDDPLIELRDGDEVQIGQYTLEVQVAMEETMDIVLAGHAASDWND